MTAPLRNQAMRSIGAVVASVAAIGCSETEATPETVVARGTTQSLDHRETVPDPTPTRPVSAVVGDPGAADFQGSEAERLLVAASVGGSVGEGIDERMDDLAGTLEGELEAAEVMRFAEGIVVTIGVGMLFDEGSDAVAPAALDYLARLADHLVDAPRTDLTVIGHTDRLGSAAENLRLSEERARAAAEVLQGEGVEAGRITTVGRGEAEPVALDDATSEESARLNRRIEIAIYAGEAMKRELTTPMEDE